jgi:hypothetical protein
MGRTACTEPQCPYKGVLYLFRTCPEWPWDPPSLLYNGYRVFPRGKERSGRDADPLPTSSVVGLEIVELYFYFPYRPYGLYRASGPVQGWPLPLYILKIFFFNFDTNLSIIILLKCGHIFSPEVLFFMALRSNAGHGLLIHEVSRSHTTTQHSR